MSRSLDEETKFLATRWGIHPNYVQVIQRRLEHYLATAEGRPLDNKDILVVADIHGNAPALEKVLSYSEDHGFRHLLSLGDLLDYNSENDRVLELVMGYPRLVANIRGNHDHFIWEEGQVRTAKEGYAICEHHWAKALEKSPTQLIVKGSDLDILLCHANPWLVDTLYLHPMTTELHHYFLTHNPVNGFMYGHTHIGGLYQHEKKFSLNPGSIGKSRGKKDHITFVWWEGRSNMVTFVEWEHHPENIGNLLGREPKTLGTYKLGSSKDVLFITDVGQLL